MGITKSEGLPKYVGSIDINSKIVNKISKKKTLSSQTILHRVNREDYRIVENKAGDNPKYYSAIFRDRLCYCVESESRIYIFR